MLKGQPVSDAMPAIHNPDDDVPRNGRPTKLTDPLFRAFIELFLKGSFRSTACQELGVPYNTFRRWMSLGRKHKDGIYGQFRAGVMAAESRSQNNLLGRITAASSEDWKAAAWILERKFPDLYGAYRGELGELKRQIKSMEREVAKVSIGPAEQLPDQETD